jgi:hypothetical protein
MVSSKSPLTRRERSFNLFKAKSGQADADLPPGYLVPQDYTPLEQAILTGFTALSSEQLTFREIVDRLEAEGFDRAKVVQVIRSQTRQWRIRSDYTGPLVAMAVCLVLLLWGSTPPGDGATATVRGLKWFSVVLAWVLFVPTLIAVTYKYYDLIPGLNQLLRPLRHWRERRNAALRELDAQFFGAEIDEHSYEAQLVALLGGSRGRVRFRAMRNQKHFGMD